MKCDKYSININWDYSGRRDVISNLDLEFKFDLVSQLSSATSELCDIS